MDYMSNKFGVDNSSRFSFKARTDPHTDALAHTHTHTHTHTMSQRSLITLPNKK